MASDVEVLVENHRAFLRFLEKRVGGRAVAEDILQDAFAKSLDKVATLREDESAVAWFYRVLRNAVIDHHRRHAASDRALERFAGELADAEEPAKEMREEVCGCIVRLAGTLKPEYTEALDMIDVGGLSVKDFAELHGISATNAGVRVHRAREALRKQVAASCGTCAEHGCLNCSCS